MNTVTLGNPTQGSENLTGSVLTKGERIKLQTQLVLFIGEIEHPMQIEFSDHYATLSVIYVSHIRIG